MTAMPGTTGTAALPAMPATPGMLVVGLDAMDASLARRLAGEGRMPTLARLLTESAWAPTRNPDGIVVGAVWPSFATGRWPGRHGFYCFRQILNGTYEIARRTPNDIAPTPFWQTLSRQGRRVCVLDAPLSSLVADIDGLQSIDWGTHDRMLAPAWSPDPLGDDLLSRHGAHPVVGSCDGYMRRGEGADLCDRLARGMAVRTDMCLELLAGEPWDLFLVVYGESHCAGHQFWSLHDPTWPGHDPALADRLGDPLETTYESLDHELGRLLDGVDAVTPVLVLLSHGIGPHHDGDHLFAEIVRRLDVASGRASLGRRLAEIARRRVERLRRKVAQRRRGDRPSTTTSVDGSRGVYSIPNNELFGAVRINLVGREPRGRVARGLEYDELLDWLSERFLELEDADTGEPLVRRVLRVDDLYPGEMRDDLPDLLVDWRRDGPITSARSPIVGVVRGSYQGIRSGDHRPSGLAILRAPGIEPGPRSAPIDVVDLAPTITARLGVELTGIDGQARPTLV